MQEATERIALGSLQSFDRFAGHELVSSSDCELKRIFVGETDVGLLARLFEVSQLDGCNFVRTNQRDVAMAIDAKVNKKTRPGERAVIMLEGVIIAEMNHFRVHLQGCSPEERWPSWLLCVGGFQKFLVLKVNLSHCSIVALIAKLNRSAVRVSVIIHRVAND